MTNSIKNVVVRAAGVQAAGKSIVLDLLATILEDHGIAVERGRREDEMISFNLADGDRSLLAMTAYDIAHAGEPLVSVMSENVGLTA